MQSRALSVPMIFHRMEEVFPQSLITSVRGEVSTAVRYADWARDVRRMVTSLHRLGLGPGSRVATLCANTVEHLTLYYAVPCAGYVLHTVNHRLSPAQIDYTLADAGARVLVVDSEILSTHPSLANNDALEAIVVVGDGELKNPRLISFDDLLRAPATEGDFEIDDENQAAAICYTSGTTGSPKGVVYSHRSLVLVALMSMAPDVIGLSAADVVMPIVPMFHANAWALPFSAAFAGSDVVLPGAGRTGRDLADLMERHGVTVAAAVASVRRDVLPHVDEP